MIPSEVTMTQMATSCKSYKSAVLTFLKCVHGSSAARPDILIILYRMRSYSCMEMRLFVTS